MFPVEVLLLAISQWLRLGRDNSYKILRGKYNAERVRIIADTALTDYCSLKSKNSVVCRNRITSRQPDRTQLEANAALRRYCVSFRIDRNCFMAGDKTLFFL
jgi:hypothetical protein